MAELPSGFQKVGNAAAPKPPPGFRKVDNLRADDFPDISSRGFPEGSGLFEQGLAATGILSAAGQDERAAILEKQFPGEFEFLEDQDRNLLVRNKKGEVFALNAPGLSGSDITSFIFRTFVNLPAGRAKSAATSALGNLASRAAQVGLKSGVAEAGLQGVEAAAGGEFDAGEVGLATGLGGVAEGAMGAVGAIRHARANRVLPDTGTEVADAVEAAQEATEQTGIRLTRAQQTMDPFLVEEQSFVGQLPEGARPAMRALRQQNQEAEEAVQSVLDSIGPPNSVVVGPRTIRDRAQKAIELKRAARAEKASPLYQEAFGEGIGANVDDVVRHIDGALLKYPKNHPAAKALSQMRADILDNADSLERLHGVKEGIDVQIANFADRPTSAASKATREVGEAETLLLNAMDEASPAYAQARATYARESAPVDALRESLIGRVAGISDENLKRVSRTIFDPAETNPEVVRSARKAITATEGGEEAWNQIVRAEMERRLGSMRVGMEDLSSAQFPNVPGMMKRALFPNDKSIKVLLAGMGKEQRDAVKWLNMALTRAASGRARGSQTGVRAEIRERFDKGFVNALRRLLREPIDTVANLGAEGARARQIRAAAEVIFDPDWAVEANRIRRLAGNQENRWLQMFKQIDSAFEAQTLFVPRAIPNAAAQAARAEDEERTGQPGQ